MNDREHRLRQRIDQLADQRDDAQHKLELVQRTRDKLRRRVYELEHSRDLWKHRARQWQAKRLARLK